MRKYIIIVLVIMVLFASVLLIEFTPMKTVGLPFDSEESILEESDLNENVKTDKNESKLQLTFSETGYFYEQDIDVEILSSIPDAEIYYTTDGTEPTSDSSRYTNPLKFSTDYEMNVVVLKAIAVYGDTVTRPLVHTYFIGEAGRFDTIVFSLSTNPENLYDYETGIFVEGQLRDEFEQGNPKKEITPPDPANYNIRGNEGERPVYVEVFTPEGERVIAQAAGIRASGGWSRAIDQKSIRLIAKKEYEPGVGKFQYNFFENETICDGFDTPLTKYDELLLRNGANDRDFGMLRNEVASLLARDAGFREVTPVRAAAVFLNGEYYGFAWLQVKINEQYLEDIYEAPTKDFDIVGDGEQWFNSDNTAAIESLEEVNSYANRNLSDDAVFAELEKLVDIDNLLLYYAFEMYMGNDDWPNNNLKRWRYIGEQQEGLAPELDGRWRYIMYDLDWTLGLYGDNYEKDTFKTVLEGNDKRSPLLVAILKRTDMADKFATILCGLAESIITRDTVEDYIFNLYDEATNEINEAFAAYKYSHWVSEYSVLDNHSNMIEFAENRSVYVYNSLRNYFGYGTEMFSINVTGGEALIGTHRGVYGRYFDTLSVKVSPVLPEFTVFDHWVLNGKEIYDYEITVSALDAIAGGVELELVTRFEKPPLIIKAAYSSSEHNGCILYNTLNKPVTTSGYFLSDNLDNPFRWKIPAATVEPDGELILAGKGSKSVNDLLKIQMGFKVKNKSILYLFDENGTVLHSVRVMSEN